MMQQINHREAFGFWLNRFGLVGDGAEVGCARGEFAKTVLSQWNGTRYYMIDPWGPQSKEVYKERQPEKSEYDKWFASCEELAKSDSRVSLVRKLSLDAVSMFADYSLHWVYIDANHCYRNVMEDMDAWWSKVKLGGILGGHDFLNKTDEGWFVEVEPAVIRWTKERGLNFYVTPCTSWWIVK